MFMIMVADGPAKTAHYALCTGFMALGMMLPGMASGWLQQQLGYTQLLRLGLRGHAAVGGGGGASCASRRTSAEAGGDAA
jgi:hypothetical protein